jgi:hypothetical protein
VKYMMLIYEGVDAPRDPDMIPKHQAFAEEMGRRGKLVAAGELSDVAVATTVRRREGEMLITDGPHAETKEYLGGYYIVECADLDEALDIASRLPLVPGGAAEVRPLVER